MVPEPSALVFHDTKFYIKGDVTLYAIWKKSSGGDSVKPGDNSTVKVGSTQTVGKAKYRVTSQGAVTYLGTTDKKAKKLTIPDTIKIKGKTYKVTAVGTNVAKSNKKLTSVIIGKNVTDYSSQSLLQEKETKEH